MTAFDVNVAKRRHDGSLGIHTAACVVNATICCEATFEFGGTEQSCPDIQSALLDGDYWAAAPQSGVETPAYHR